MPCSSSSTDVIDFIRESVRHDALINRLIKSSAVLKTRNQHVYLLCIYKETNSCICLLSYLVVARSSTSSYRKFAVLLSG